MGREAAGITGSNPLATPMPSAKMIPPTGKSGVMRKAKAMCEDGRCGQEKIGDGLGSVRAIVVRPSQSVKNKQSHAKAQSHPGERPFDCLAMFCALA